MQPVLIQPVVSHDRFDRWIALFDKGMYQLARVEVRHAAERPDPRPELAFAVGMCELALRRWTQAMRSFIRAMDALQKRGPENLPARAKNLGAVLARVRDYPDLRLIPIPNQMDFWLAQPNRVGEVDNSPQLSSRLPQRIQSVKFVSPINLDSMKELERRASTFSYDVFDLSKKQGNAPTVARESRDRVKKSRHDVKRPGSAPVEPPRQAVQPAPKPVATWAPEMPAQPVHPAVATVAVAGPIFSASAFDPTPPTTPLQPQPVNPADQWSQWENELYRLVLERRFPEALERANSAVGRYPTSSRLREHQAYVLSTSGDTNGAVQAWIETWKLANSTGADERATASARKALALVWNDAPQLAATARQLAAEGKPAILRAVLAAAAERLLADNRLAAFESIGLAMAELAIKDASSHPDAQRVVSLIERLSGEDARAIAKRLKDRLKR